MKRIGFIAGDRIKKRGDWEPSLKDAIFEMDDFLGDILKDEWAVDLGGNGESVAIVAALRGTVVLTTVAGDNYHASLARELNYNAVLAAGIEARIALDIITNVTIEVGLVDAKSYAQGRAFDDYDGTGGVPTPVATNAAIIGYDPTDSTVEPFDKLTGVGAIAGVGKAVDLGIDLTGGAMVILRVQLDALGNAYFYVNGVLKGTILLAVTPATPLTPWLAISNKAGAIARILTADFCKVWQNR